MGRPKSRPSMVQSKPAPSPLFHSLPRELRDKIYGYAFAHQSETLNVISKTDWVRREKDRIAEQNHGYTARPKLVPTPFPGCPLNQMAVSKTFYEEATSVFMQVVILSFPTAYELSTFVRRMKGSLAIPSITTIHINQYDTMRMDKIKLCVGLRELRMTLRNDMSFPINDEGRSVEVFVGDQPKNGVFSINNFDIYDVPGFSNRNERHLIGDLNEADFNNH